MLDSIGTVMADKMTAKPLPKINIQILFSANDELKLNANSSFFETLDVFAEVAQAW